MSEISYDSTLITQYFLSNSVMATEGNELASTEQSTIYTELSEGGKQE